MFFINNTIIFPDKPTDNKKPPDKMSWVYCRCPEQNPDGCPCHCASFALPGQFVWCCCSTDEEKDLRKRIDAATFLGLEDLVLEFKEKLEAIVKANTAKALGYWDLKEENNAYGC